MTCDQDRAAAFVTQLLGAPDPDAAAGLALILGAVRLDERRAVESEIGVWLLEETGMIGPADRIARGTWRS